MQTGVYRAVAAGAAVALVCAAITASAAAISGMPFLASSLTLILRVATSSAICTQDRIPIGLDTFR